ncbi:cell division topological specificity factor MinE [Nitrospirillum iridis]|uniref:Cell division topological specificity factor n=1 Tax=Nitrospirillum iridis TaxID=765888 RepID=A0A7X0EGT5_9PROT|nr:cell division topological specificity factor MinE [Nitrospirillum iridis]MBB6253934.1 cell division topological specificity factor [Nitrospirillum iridis]
MSIFDFFRTPKKASAADQAKERLQIVLAHERAGRDSPDFLPQLQKELLDVIKKYVSIDDDKVAVKLDRASGYSTLEVNVELPAPAKGAARSGGAGKVAAAGKA